VLKERAHPIVSSVFWLAAIASFLWVLLASPIRHDPSRVTSAILIFLYWFLWGLYGSVESTFCVSRPSGSLEIRSKVLWFSFKHVYSVNEVSHVSERKTMKGNGLRMQLQSGKKKALTLFTEYVSLEAQVTAINYFIHAARHCQSKRS
jgi:hypothetical protein